MLSNINGTVLKKIWHKKFFDIFSVSKEPYQTRSYNGIFWIEVKKYE